MGSVKKLAKSVSYAPVLYKNMYRLYGKLKDAAPSADIEPPRLVENIWKRDLKHAKDEADPYIAIVPDIESDRTGATIKIDHRVNGLLLDEQDSANARLIAAVPDICLYLGRLREAAKRHPEGAGIVQELKTLLDDMLNIVVV